MDENVLKQRLYVRIPNDDVVVSAIKRVTSLGGLEVETAWRSNGSWEQIEDKAVFAFSRHSMEYEIKAFSHKEMLAAFDAGIPIDVSLVEISMQDDDSEIQISRLDHTHKLLSKLLKERNRRESEPGLMTTWITSVLASDMKPRAAEILTAVFVLLADREKQGRPILKLNQKAIIDSLPELNLDEKDFFDEKNGEGWVRLHKFVAALVALTNDVVVISVSVPHFDGPVYVQLCREDNGALTLEAESNTYLEPPLSQDAINTLKELGWEEPHDETLPNFTKFLEREEAAPGPVAQILVDTLRLVYLTKPNDLYCFEPSALVRSMLAGEFGSEVAMNPKLSAGQRGRLFLGIRFPADIGVDSTESSTQGENFMDSSIIQDEIAIIQEKKLGDSNVNNEEIQIENYPHIDAAIGPYVERLFMSQRGFHDRNGHNSGPVPDFLLPRGYVLDLIEELLERGSQWERALAMPDLVDPIHRTLGRKVVLSRDDQEFILGESRENPGIPLLWVHIGSFPRNFYLLSSLAGLPNFSENRLLLVSTDSKGLESLDIWFGWNPTEVLDAPAVLSCAQWARSVTLELQKAMEGPLRGEAMEDLASTFRRAGLGVPWLPESYLPLFRRDRNWAWTTEIEPDYMEDYLFKTSLDGPLPDHVTIAHAGHGINSYALTWRMAIGPLALMVQTLWGGAIGDSSRDVGAQAELFHRVSRVVSHLATKYRDFNQEPQMRRYQWKVSTLRNVNQIRQWDGRTMTWRDLEPTGNLLETFVLKSPE